MTGDAEVSTKQRLRSGPAHSMSHEVDASRAEDGTKAQLRGRQTRDSMIGWEYVNPVIATASSLYPPNVLLSPQPDLQASYADLQENR
jgi:hypothetical protein